MHAKEWTVGCEIQALLLHGKQYVEFWDVGGHEDYEDSRKVFYSGIDGLILVYDVSNAKSLTNLRKWWDEICAVDLEMKKKLSVGVEAVPPSYGNGATLQTLESSGLPVLIVGNKLDAVNKVPHLVFPQTLQRFPRIQTTSRATNG